MLDLEFVTDQACTSTLCRMYLGSAFLSYPWKLFHKLKKSPNRRSCIYKNQRQETCSSTKRNQ